MNYEGNYCKIFGKQKFLFKRGELSGYLHETGAENSLNLKMWNLKVEIQIFINAIPHLHICKSIICLRSYKMAETVQFSVRLYWLENAGKKKPSCTLALHKLA